MNRIKTTKIDRLKYMGRQGGRKPMSPEHYTKNYRPFRNTESKRNSPDNIHASNIIWLRMLYYIFKNIYKST